MQLRQGHLRAGSLMENVRFVDSSVGQINEAVEW